MLLTNERPEILIWQAETLNPLPGVPFTVYWKAERALYVRIKGFRKKLPLSGSMSIVIHGDSKTLELEAIGLGNKTTSLLHVTCLKTVQLQNTTGKDLFGLSKGRFVSQTLVRFNSPETRIKLSFRTLFFKPIWRKKNQKIIHQNIKLHPITFEEVNSKM